MNSPYSFYPRKMRRVNTSGKQQHLLSIPNAIAKVFPDGTVFHCTMQNGSIVFTPITQESEDAA